MLALPEGLHLSQITVRAPPSSWFYHETVEKVVIPALRALPDHENQLSVTLL